MFLEVGKYRNHRDIVCYDIHWETVVVTGSCNHTLWVIVVQFNICICFNFINDNCHCLSRIVFFQFSIPDNSLICLCHIQYLNKLLWATFHFHKHIFAMNNA